VLERLADRVARELEIDRAEVRRRSFVRADQFPYKTGMLARDGSPVAYDSGDYAACLDAAWQAIGAAEFPPRQAKARENGRYIGLGIASYVEDTGLPPFEGAAVKIERNGSVLISTGAASQGQGHQTMLAQIAADVLAIPIERIRVVSADTGAFPHGIGTIGSRVAATAGPSVHLAAHKVRDKAIKLAADMLEAAETDLVLADGFVRVAGTDKSIGLSEIARRTEGDAAMPLPPGVEPGLAATAYHETRATTFASGTNVAEVEVDSDTGAVKVLRYVMAHDCGKLINPLLVDGQIRGGVVHGIGNALFERMVYDEEAQPLSTNYADYLLPSAPEMPRVEIMHLEHPSPLNPIGVKGAGEGGTIPAAACIVSAIEDALAPFGVKLAEHPLSPEAILAVIRNASAQP
jgi:carbon-monoxide dehydrogenase large subunit